MVYDRRFREVAPDAFIFPGENFYEIGGTDDFLTWAFPLYKHGADAFYCSGSLATARAAQDWAYPALTRLGCTLHP
jgi:3-methyl-2-oxobutanoate hydroxymethyltransferase